MPRGPAKTLKGGRRAAATLDYDEMADFVRHTMKMTSVYQPIVIRTLIESGGEATDEDVARAFLGEDKRQLEYYVRIAKRWPRNVLEGHGVVGYRKGARGESGTFTLRLEGATDAQRRRIAELCNLRLEEYIDKETAGMPLFGGTGQRPAASDAARDAALARSGGMCAACSTPLHKTSTRFDYIVPPGIGGGADDPSNLQALCAVCSVSRKDRNALEFLLVRNRLMFRKGCYLCGVRESADLGNELAVAVPASRATYGDHWIVAPKSHVPRFEDMLPAERHFCMDLIEPAKVRMRQAGYMGRGFSVSMRDAAAGGRGHFGIDVVPAPSAA